jgi:signal transduction histidine kinase
MNWLGRLKRRRKLVLIVCAVLLPIFILAGVFVHQSSTAIAFSSRELMGTSYLRAAWSTLSALDSDEEAGTAALDQAAMQYNAPLSLESDYGGLTTALTWPKNGAEGLRAFITRISDASNLTLDPQIDSYYLMHIATSDLPEVARHSHALQNTFEAVARKPQRTASDLASIDSGITLLSQTGGATNRSVGAALRGTRDTTLADAVLPVANNYDYALDTYIAHAHALSAAVTANRSLSRSDVASLAADRRMLQVATDSLWLVSINQLDRLLNKRVAKARLDLWLTLGLAGLVAVLALGVAIALDIYIEREEVMKLNASLRQSNEELERFAYICSHDMQEPVRMMNLYAGLLDEDAGSRLDEANRRHLQYIRENAVRMQKMIRDILTFSRVGRENVGLEPVDCNAIMREVMAEFEPVLAANSGRLTWGKLPVLVTNITLVRILLQNLVGNALKFQDGTRAPEISVSATQVAGMWRFDVSDNGIGIDEAFRDRVFTIFQRLHRNEDYPGTGIGLSTCRKFVQLFGGTIDFTSTPGEGSVFSFTIPAKEA